MSATSRPVVLRGGRVVDPAAGKDEPADLLLADGKLQDRLAPGAQAPGEAEEIDVGGGLVLPGALDVGARLRDPGREAEEPLRTTLELAAAGGFCSVLGLPWTEPVVDGAEGVSQLLAASRAGPAGLLVAGALTTGGEGQELADLGEMSAAGAVAFAGNTAKMSDAVLRRALEYARTFDRPALLKPSAAGLARGAGVAESPTSTRLGLEGAPEAGEVIQVFRALELTLLTGARVVLGPLSSRRSAELVAAARADGLSVAGFVDVWALTLDEGAHLERPYDTTLKFDPPLREPADREALRAFVERGDLFVASGHRPSSPIYKEVEFDLAEAGSSSLATALPLLADPERGGLSPAALAGAVAQGPARALGLTERGHLKNGARADLTVLDLDASTTLTRALLGRAKHHPLLGEKVKAAVRGVVVGGRWTPAEGARAQLD